MPKPQGLGFIDLLGLYGVILGLYRVYIGIMEKNMETTKPLPGGSGDLASRLIMEKKIDTTISFRVGFRV